MADTVDLPKDGTAKITIGKDRYVLRQPTLGEMRKLRELYDEMIETFRAIQTANIEAALDPKKKAKKANDDEMVVGWVREAFLTLSEAALPPDDELPSWIVDGRFPKDLIEHWRTNPLHYGEK
jgi:hypothetical protein